MARDVSRAIVVGNRARAVVCGAMARVGREEMVEGKDGRGEVRGEFPFLC